MVALFLWKWHELSNKKKIMSCFKSSSFDLPQHLLGGEYKALLVI